MTNPTVETPTVSLTLRLPKNVHALLTKHAKLERSSLNRHIVLVLATDAYETRNRDKARRKAK